MKFKIDRRSFLQALIAAGAAYSLPANATKTQVEQIWSAAQSDPWFFKVNDHGTLIEEGVMEPETWGDVFDYLTGGEFKDPETTIEELQGCYPLSVYLDDQLDKEIETLEWDVDDDPDDLTQESQKALAQLKEKIEALKALREDYEAPWQEWMALEGKEGLTKFKELVEEWLAEPIDWMMEEWIPISSGAQGAAFSFFESQPYELLNEIGVVTVDGEHPGSSYVAAELRSNIDDANAAAERLGLPFRFKRESS